MRKHILLLLGAALLVLTACNKEADQPDTQAPDTPTITIGERTATSVQLLLTSTDNLGAELTYTITYGSTTKTAKGASGTQVPVLIEGLQRLTTYQFKVIATDPSGNQSKSASKSYLAIEPSAKLEQAGTSRLASLGTFTKGYTYSFAWQDNLATITFELLETGLTGVKATIVDATLSSETTAVATANGNKVSYTYDKLAQGVQLVLSCKFEYSGGTLITKEWVYNVGDFTIPTTDTQAPADLTLGQGKVGGTSLELMLQGTDASGEVTYEITRNGTTTLLTALSGVQTAYYLEGLSLSTPYAFSVVASDPYGNKTEAKTLSITTGSDANVVAGRTYGGMGNAAEFGSFEQGYTYKFVTRGSNVDIQFTMIEQRTGMVAYLLDANNKQLLRTEAATISYTMANVAWGATIAVAARFEYPNGQSKTKLISYVVGAESPVDTDAPTGLSVTKGVTTSYSAELLVKASDATSALTYKVTNVATGLVVKQAMGLSGVETPITVKGLDASTSYNFTVVAVDYAGNVSQAAAVSATTEAESTEVFTCSKSGLTGAFEGSFTQPYGYTFSTQGSKVTIVFDVPETLGGKEMQIWVNNAEVSGAIANAANTQVTVVLSGQAAGDVLDIKCRIPYTGSIKTTDTYKYTVGTSCN